jgi:hypothetical protein
LVGPGETRDLRGEGLEETVTCRSRTEIGIPATPDESFWRAMRPLILWLGEHLAAT